MRATLVTVVLAAVFTPFTAAAPADLADRATANPTVHVVPGAWHQQAVYLGVRYEIEKLGYPTSGSNLDTVGDTDPTKGLMADAAGIRSDITALVNAGKEVVVMAHSYGGLAASNAVDGLSVAQRKAAGKTGGVLSIVYVAAFTLPKGLSLYQAVGNQNLPWWNVSSDGKFVNPSTPQKIFYNDCSPLISALASAMLKQEPYRIITDATAFEPWSSPNFQVGYIYTQQDNALGLSTQQALTGGFPASSFKATLNTGHAPMLSNPSGLASAVVQAAQQAVANHP